MYSSYFGFHGQPFGKPARPDEVMYHHSFNVARTMLQEGIDCGRGLMLVTGELGTGKTTLLLNLRQCLKPGTRVVSMLYTGLGLTDFIDCNRDALNQRPGVGEESATIGSLQERLLNLNVGGDIDGKVPVVLIDDAQNLDTDVLRNLATVYRLGPGEDSLAQIVLIGSHEFEQTLRNPELRRLDQLIESRCRLDALSTPEVHEYIDFSLRAVGATLTDIFTPEAVTEIARCSRGIPQLINTVCNAALLVVFEQAKNIVTVDDVETARREIVNVAVIDTASSSDPVKSAPEELGGVVADRIHPSDEAAEHSSSHGRQPWWVAVRAKVQALAVTPSQRRTGARQAKVKPAAYRKREPIRNQPRRSPSEPLSAPDVVRRRSNWVYAVLGFAAGSIAWSVVLLGLLRLDADPEKNALQLQVATERLEKLGAELVVAQEERRRLSLELAGVTRGLFSVRSEHDELTVALGQVAALVETRSSSTREVVESGRSADSPPRADHEPSKVESPASSPASGVASSQLTSVENSHVTNGGIDSETNVAPVSVASMNSGEDLLTTFKGDIIVDVSSPDTTITYEVRRGDTLWKIAHGHGVTVDALANANRLTNAHVLQPGRHLVIPGTLVVSPAQVAASAQAEVAKPTWYTVQAGDSLFGIGQKFEKSVATLREWNQLADADQLQVGQRIRLHE